ncbi:hypothetical protein SAMN06264849_11019 [Melghirimyces algeriensis]|uniref:Uncharacterized protein n=1 Tax=Melghirimyces algeriensis TaxID=910412 RepID=A0A521ENJ8_9BACL|nr:hypothetical protein SAMN06264849_11019 [Melghirimyces algeriensis]
MFFITTGYCANDCGGRDRIISGAEGATSQKALGKESLRQTDHHRTHLWKELRATHGEHPENRVKLSGKKTEEG